MTDTKKSQPDCYGGMFPDMENFDFNHANMGKVFGAKVTSHGIGHNRQKVMADHDAYAKCKECPFFTDCHDLSFGQLLMYAALKHS